MKLLYLTHDLSDAAISKRTMMLKDGGAVVTLAGFRRPPQLIHEVAGCLAINFGQTHNGGFIQRLLSVFKIVLTLGKHRHLFEGTDIILARNLEMLAIAVRGSSMCSHKPKIVYECLDIHRLLLGTGIVSKCLRTLEGWLSKRASAVLTSSPAFITEYFEARSNVKLPMRLVENKIYPLPAYSVSERPASKPWRIGWFGIIRCRKSLAILSELARSLDGAVEVIIRGRPALDQFDDFHHTVTNTPHLTFHGAYKNPDDLSAMYNEVHFNWAIDMFEEGLNSSWLLPNRLYEGGLFGCIPIAQKNVETGRTMDRLSIGVTLADISSASLVSFFNALTPEKYLEHSQKLRSLPDNIWYFNKLDCKELVEYLGSV